MYKKFKSSFAPAFFYDRYVCKRMNAYVYALVGVQKNQGEMYGL